MEFLYYYLPKAIQYAAYFASFVLLVLLWRRTRIFGFAALAVVSLFGHVYSYLLAPYIAKNSGIGHAVILTTWVYMALAVLGALAMWHVYVHMRRAEA